MKKTALLKFIPATLVLALPVITLAAPSAGATEAAKFVGKFNTIILFPTIALLSAVALLVFLWGVAEYFFNATSDQGREQGVKHITWGIIGLVIMLSAYAILKIAVCTFGLCTQLDCASDPTKAGCENVFTIPAKNGGPVGNNPGGASGGNPGGASGGNP
ncbi:MAG: hypothetical protein KBC35_00960 [Candidatus Pacebacteria bacterium]|nr:hypothetical protein [Candidatus Paceibacterota bacterium]